MGSGTELFLFMGNKKMFYCCEDDRSPFLRWCVSSVNLKYCRYDCTLTGRCLSWGGWSAGPTTRRSWAPLLVISTRYVLQFNSHRRICNRISQCAAVFSVDNVSHIFDWQKKSKKISEKSLFYPYVRPFFQKYVFVLEKMRNGPFERSVSFFLAKSGIICPQKNKIKTTK